MQALRDDTFRDILAAGGISLRALERRQREENHEKNQSRDRENQRDFDDREAGRRESSALFARRFVVISRKIRSVISFAG